MTPALNQPIQKFIFPDPELSDCRELYFRGSELAVQVRTQATGSTLLVNAGGVLTTDTFFNAFSLSPWAHATHLKNVFVQIKLQGSCEIQICHLQKENETILERVQVHNGQYLSGKLHLEELKEGLLYVRLVAHSSVEIQTIAFVTDITPTRPVKLGIVITTFNRQQQTLSAIRRLSKTLSELPKEERAQYKFLIVDNGRNLKFQSTEEFEAIPNANLGGSGGFMRGLIELQERGSFTHCLFMDDDASCVFESIRRSVKLFEYSALPKLAIAGAMILNEPSYMQQEFTAYVKRLSRPRLSGLDLRQANSLIKNDSAAPHLLTNKSLHDEKGASYTFGGWWFFVFALVDVQFYSFPFFVRGDDTFFSIHNKLTVLAMNGISSWQDSFSSKDNPTVTYLACRSDLAQTVMLPNKSLVSKLLDCVWIAYYRSFKPISEGKNLDAKAALKGTFDFLKGPDFWFKNINYATHLSRLFTELKPINDPTKRTIFSNIMEIGSLSFKAVLSMINVSLRAVSLSRVYSRSISTLKSPNIWKDIFIQKQQ